MATAERDSGVSSAIARLLGSVSRGDPDALSALVAFVYRDLKAIAHRRRCRWRSDCTLTTTALVHETYLKLAGQRHIATESRAHFLALAAVAMRQVLSNHARTSRAAKRGGRLEKCPLDAEPAIAGAGVGYGTRQLETILALDEALERLERLQPRLSRVVECRFFGGLTVAETGAALGISPRTVKRDWLVAQAWLHREIGASVR